MPPLFPDVFVIAISLVAAYSLWRRFRAWHGLDQWPDPRGRFYHRWMKLPHSAGNYYEWLAEQKGGREPWATWARLEKRLERSTSRSDR